MGGVDLKELTRDAAWSLEANGEQGRQQGGEHDAMVARSTATISWCRRNESHA